MHFDKLQKEKKMRTEDYLNYNLEKKIYFNNNFWNKKLEKDLYNTINLISPKNNASVFKGDSFDKILNKINYGNCESAIATLKEHNFHKINSADFYFDSYKLSKMINSDIKLKWPENKIVVMTEVAWGTLGDYYAAEKCIQAMKKAYPQFMIQWIIMNHNNSYLPENAGIIADSFITVTDWNTLLNHKNSSGQLWFESAALVFQFPTFHFLPISTQMLIREALPNNTSILECLEYDFLANASGSGAIQAGLRDDSIGIFIDAVQVQPVREILSNIKETEVGQFLLGMTTPETYQQTNLCFFAYFNKEFSRVLNRQVNAQNYCDIVATYTAKQNLPQKSLDIICRMTPEEVVNFDPTKIFEANVNSIVFLVDDQFHTMVNPKPTQNGRFVRIYSDFPFPTELFQQLMRLAYQSAIEAKIIPFIGCTGDQSLSEVLSLSGAVPFYQIMAWKIHLYTALNDIAQNSTYAADYLQRIGSTAGIYFFMNIANMLCEFNIQKEWNRIHEFILQHKNLYVNLPDILFKEIQKQHPLLIDKLNSTHSNGNAFSL